MPPIQVNEEICKACGVCVTVCTKNVLQGNGQPKVTQPENCTVCGHCVAVCPADALSHDQLKPTGFSPVGDCDVSAETMATFLRSKRSIRRFKDMPVEREVLEQLLDVARMAPSDKNRQARGFIVITDREKIRAMDRAVAESFRKLLRILSKPMRAVLKLSLPALIGQLEKNIPSLQSLVKRSDAGEYPVFHDAPCVILGYGPKGNMLAKDTSVSAQQYLMLQAQAMGLGSCIIGYASTRPKALLPFVNLPAGQQILTATILGYPAVTFRKTVDRKPAAVQWD